MTKIRCGKHFGINLDQVIAWNWVEHPTTKEQSLFLIFPGCDESYDIDESHVGSQAFAWLHKLLLDRFAIDLAGDNSLPIEDDKNCNLVNDLEDLSY